MARIGRRTARLGVIKCVCVCVLWKRVSSAALKLLVPPAPAICFPPFRWNLYLPLRITHKQSSRRKRRRKFLSICKTVFTGPFMAVLWCIFEICKYDISVIALQSLTTPPQTPTPNPQTQPPTVSLFLFHSLSPRGETSPVSAARNITADCSICLVQQIPFSPARVAGFHFHRGEKYTSHEHTHEYFFFTSQYKPNSMFPTLNQKVVLDKKVFTNFCIRGWCMTSSASLLFLQLPVWASLLHHKAVFIFIGSLCSLKIWFEEVGACERVCKNSIDAILWSSTQCTSVL